MQLGVDMTKTAAAIRTEILAQHQALRVQLGNLRREAERAFRAGPGEPADLRGMLRQADHALTAHMAFEDEHLPPLLAGRNPFGDRYATLLHDEHARQRDELGAITRWAEDPDDPTSLALAIAAFAGDLLNDMDDEELQFLTPHLLAGDQADEIDERAVGR
jgi:iron-sulfur cluster repair protein YtfE (RIC family)